MPSRYLTFYHIDALETIIRSTEFGLQPESIIIRENGVDYSDADIQKQKNAIYENRAKYNEGMAKAWRNMILEVDDE